jgi:superfamily II DNA or RNA helicase
VEEVIKVWKANHAFIKVDCSPSIAMELHEYFSFEAPGAKFMPTYKARVWDGKIRLFGLLTKELYSGLYLHLHEFCKARNYRLEKLESEYGLPLQTHSIKENTLEAFIKALKLTDANAQPLEVYSHQFEAIFKGLRHKNKLFLSPTASGKSLIIYVMTRYLRALFKHKEEAGNILIVVPTLGLLTQMYNDFKEYSQANGWPVDKFVSKIQAGLPKDPPTPIVISTWQGIYSQPKAFFQRYRVVIGDEAHQYKAKSLIAIMTKATEAEWRIGTTGTLDGIETNKLVLQGLFGSVQQVATTKELQELGVLSKLSIKCIVLKYSDADRTSMSGKDYQEEIKFLIGNEKRNKFIRNLALSQKANTLVLFSRVGSHGAILSEMIKTKAATGRKVFFVHGQVDADEREAVRQITEKEANAIIVASYGTFSTGINIKNLHSVIFASPSKSKIRNLQSIGRGLRVTDGKDSCTLYDIADDLQTKKRVNFAIKHLVERIEIYNQENFDFNIVEVPFA